MSELMEKAGDFDANPPVSVLQYDNSMKKFCAAYDEIFIMAHAYLKSIVSNKAEVLVVGAGTGAESRIFAADNPSWKITGVDPSAEMLSIAKSKLESLGLKNVDLFRGYTDELPEEADFDAATCILVMHFLKDDGSKLKLLKDINSRLKPGAPFILVDAFGDKDSRELSNTLSAWKKYVVLMGVDENIVEDGFNNQIMKRLNFVTEERMISLLEEAGFGYITRFFTGFLYGGWAAIKNE